MTGKLAIMDLKAGDDAVRILDLAELVGMSDLHDPGNGFAPDLVAVGIEGDKLLLISRDDISLGRPAHRGPPKWRAWLADISTGAVDLVGYSDAPSAE